MINISRLLIVSLLLATLGAIAATPVVKPSSPALVTDTNHYALGVGDVVRLSVYDHLDLTLEAEVAPDGTLNVPLVGSVKVAGLTFKQAENLISARFVTGGYLKEPHVNILITQYRSQLVSVLGEVNQPGRYPLSGDTSLVSVLAAAGGISQLGGTQVDLIHNGQSHSFDISTLSKSNPEINQVKVQPGDRVFIPRQKMIFVYGEVLRPGSYPLMTNMTVMKAIAMAGGFTGKANKRDIELQRPSHSGEVDNQPAGLSMLLESDDVIYVNESLF